MVAAAMIRHGCLALPEKARNDDTYSSSIVTTRSPNADDAVEVTRLVKNAGTLELNTGYAYVLLCTHFAQTCALAHSGGELIGCALGYRVPDCPDTLFIWQVGVAKEHRMRGVGRRLLDELVRRDCLQNIDYITTTIAPSNTGSRRLFERWAARHDLIFKSVGSFASVLFADESEHESETVYQIGPLREFK